MIVFDYNKAIHPDSGKKYEVINDIIITPFWTEEFCKVMVDASELYQDRFHNFVQGPAVYAWKDLALNHLSDVTFLYYCRQYKRDLIPIMHKVYDETVEITGWFTPAILRYDKIGNYVAKHYDISLITTNIKLNNDYKGCDLVWPRQQFDSRDVPPGYAMIWPGTVTHPHFSTPLESGKKYSLSSWTWPPAWHPDKSGSIPNTDQL